jgi:CheY-like chemotaxis protein
VAGGPAGDEGDASLAGRSILVVDDEADVREVLRTALEDRGARVACAASVAEALAHYATEPPEVVVSDIGMPGADGYALAERLGLACEGSVPAIALTAYAAREDAARARAAGFRRHLAKPVDAAEVIRAVAELLPVRT